MSALSSLPPPTGFPSTAPATPTGAPQPVNGRPGGLVLVVLRLQAFADLLDLFLTVLTAAAEFS